MRFDWIYDGDNKFLDLFLTKKLLGYLIELNKITHSWFFFFSIYKVRITYLTLHLLYLQISFL